jgi:hypothetical protein
MIRKCANRFLSRQARSVCAGNHAWTTRLGQQLDEDAPCVNAPTWEFTGAVNAGRRPIRKFQKFQNEKARGQFPGAGSIVAMMDIRG